MTGQVILWVVEGPGEDEAKGPSEVGGDCLALFTARQKMLRTNFISYTSLGQKQVTLVLVMTDCTQ